MSWARAAAGDEVVHVVDVEASGTADADSAKSPRPRQPPHGRTRDGEERRDVAYAQEWLSRAAAVR